MDARLAAYVTNTDRDVFALRNLPEEVVAVLFAYYSRSKDDLRTNLQRLLNDQELALLEGTSNGSSLSTAQDKARQFHEKWVVGYGHASVAEHAVVHLAVERCSIVAAKALEEARLAAYTEKSTRYVRFDEATLVTNIGLPEPLTHTYEHAARALLTAYESLVDRTEVALMARHPTPENTSPKAHSNVLRAHACDLARALLPAGVPTNVGVTLNARVLEHHIGKMLGSPLAEVRAIAESMRTEASVVVPTLLKYTAPRAHRDNVLQRLVSTGLSSSAPVATSDVMVRLVDHTPGALQTVATAALCDTLHLDWDHARSQTRDDSNARAIVDAYMAERGSHDQPLRALEHATARFEITCDYGAWRDLQRHRMVSATTPRLGTTLGWSISPELTELGLHDDYARALDGVQKTYEQLATTHPWEAQYVVPLGYRVRYVMQASVRELFHFIELRSARQGHESYRRVAQGIAEELLRVYPWLASHLRVDRNHYAWARH
jgi:thymidylate synthase ThyX